MKDIAIFKNKELLSQIESAQRIASMVNTPALQEAMNIVNTPVVQQACQSLSELNKMKESIQPVLSQAQIFSEFASNNIKGLLSNSIEYYTSLAQIEFNKVQSFTNERIIAYFGALANYKLFHYYPDNISDEEKSENKKIDSKVITGIFEPTEETNKTRDKKEPAIITLSPVNEKVLKYLAENPEALYQLTGRKFEEVMAEIYCKLGYNVELTKTSRDGGKDIIIRKPEVLGDFIYYVECKKYSPDKPVGVGIVRELSGVIEMDRVNGGIIATTSYFARDVRELILNNNLNYRIKLHGFHEIKNMLKMTL